MGKSNNYPQGELDKMEPATTQMIVTSLMELYDKGKPQTDEEVRQRVEDYFSFCAYSSMRPGIETLAACLHVSRYTIFNWSKGIKCSEERKEIIQGAKSLINAFIEQALLSGKINPASGIFLAKNWLGYKDSVSLEETMPQTNVKKVLTAAEIREQLENNTINE